MFGLYYHLKKKESVMALGIRSVPAVLINGKLADDCVGRGMDESTLRAAGVGQK